MGGLFGGGGGGKGYVGPLSNYWGGLAPPGPPLFLRLCFIVDSSVIRGLSGKMAKNIKVYPFTFKDTYESFFSFSTVMYDDQYC